MSKTSHIGVLPALIVCTDSRGLSYLAVSFLVFFINLLVGFVVSFPTVIVIKFMDFVTSYSRELLVRFRLQTVWSFSVRVVQEMLLKIILTHWRLVQFFSAMLWQSPNGSISLIVVEGERRLGYWHLGTGIRWLMRGMATLPQGNQELLVVKDKVGRTPGELGLSKSMECDIFPSVLWHFWLGDRKGIRPVMKLDVGLLVVMIWLELCMTYSSCSHHHLHHPLLQ